MSLNQRAGGPSKTLLKAWCSGTFFLLLFGIEAPRLSLLVGSKSSGDVPRVGSLEGYNLAALTAAGTSQTLGPSVAFAQLQDASDYDSDGVPDELEAIFGTEILYPDSDGDAFLDGFEWVAQGDPLDPLVIPQFEPSMRTFAYEAGEQIHLFTGMFPSDPSLLDRFSVVFGHESLDPSNGLGVVDLTGLLNEMVHSVTNTRALGLNNTGFTISLPVNLLETFSPLSIGLSARLAGNVVVQEITLLESNGIRMVLSGDQPHDYRSGMKLSLQPLNPLGSGGGSGGGGSGGDDPEYCETTLGEGDPSGTGGIAFRVESADCVPDGLLYCLPTECTSLEDQVLVIIDYDFLQAKAGG
jgi:hypothetical protein